MMTFFTGLTLWLAITEPIADCGCFGNALKMTNWQSFAKNAVIWPMSVLLWWSELDRKFFPFTVREGVLTVLFATMAGSLGISCYRHLPLIDFLPFKEGVNIVEEMNSEPDVDEIVTTLIYKDLQTGKEHEFELTDTTWYDTTRWEYVDTKISGVDSNNIDMSVRDFAVFDASGDVTEELLYATETTRLLVVLDLDDLDRPKVQRRVQRLVEDAEMMGDELICVTASFLSSSPYYIDLEGREVRCYDMDATTMKLKSSSESISYYKDDNITALAMNLKKYDDRIDRRVMQRGTKEDGFMYYYIEKVDDIKSEMRKTYRKEGLDALLKMLRSPAFADTEFKNYFQEFDNSIIKLYPTFVEDVNKLMKPECQFSTKRNGTLCTELRILALIRMGITDSPKIAKVLNIAIYTTYCYRHRMRRDSLYSTEEFEKQIREIGLDE